MTDMSKEAISTERALKLALEALESCGTGHISDGGSQWYDEMLVDTTIAVLREALTSVPDWASEAKEQPAQQEPVDFASLLREAEEIVREKPTWKRFIDGTPLANDIAVWMTVFAQDVARRTSPQPAQLSKPLTDEQIAEIAAQGHQRWIEFARAIEAANGIKGDA